MEATPSVDEIDISDEQSLQSVLNFLNKNSSESFRLWQFLKNIQQNIITKDHIWPHQLFVNDRHDIKCVLFIFSTIGFQLNCQLLREEEKSTERSVTFFCDEKDDDLLMSLIQHCVPWYTSKYIVFCSILHRFSSKIENFIHENRLGKCEFESFPQLELDKETFLEKNRSSRFSLPSDILIQPLSVADASLVNDLWKYKSPFTLSQIQYEIEHLPAFGAYRNKELLSWSLTKYDGSIGTVYTKPEIRGLGLGTIVNFYVLSKLFEQQQRVFCFVAYDNIASFKMLAKLGYQQIYVADWLIFSLE